MKLIKIIGKIWELSILDSYLYAESENDKTSLEEKNIISIQNGSWFNNIVRTLSNHGVKSKAHVIIEIEVNGLPHQMTYEIYHSSKGFYCNVQGQRIYLENLLSGESK